MAASLTGESAGGMSEKVIEERCHCARGWVCESHSAQPYPHEGCDHGAGMPCVNALCPYWQGTDSLALDPGIQHDETFIDRHGERQATKSRRKAS